MTYQGTLGTAPRIVRSDGARALIEMRAFQFAFCLIAALATRAFVFGDPVHHIDENWYLFVAERLNAGDRLYFDIWDRKPPGLFAIYRVFAAFPDPVIAAQAGAAVAAAGTAWLVLRMARVLAGTLAAFVAAFLYVALLAQFGGAGGQSPVFYNLLVAGAAAIVGFGKPLGNGGAPRLAAFTAMLLAGAAIIIKPTAGFEAIALGCWLGWQMAGRGMAARQWLAAMARLALVGAAPVLTLLAYYALAGGLAELIQSTVQSSFAKETQIADPMRWQRARLLLLALAFPLGAAIFALAQPQDAKFAKRRGFLICWLLAAFAGLLAVPNFYNHYTLPLLVPLCVIASGFIARGTLFLALGALGSVMPLLEVRPWDFSEAQANRAAYSELVAAVRDEGAAPRLLVYDGPPSLYRDAGSAPLTKISFPGHLWDRFERDVGPVRTSDEIHRVLALKPQVVVMGQVVSPLSTNMDTRTPVEDYLRHCQRVATVDIAGWTPTERLDVWGHCAARP